MKRAIEPLIAAEAAARKAIGENQHTKPAAKLAEVSKGDARDLVAKATRKGRTTLTKAEEIVAAAEANPKVLGGLVEKMDSTGKVDGVYRQLKRHQLVMTPVSSLPSWQTKTKRHNLRQTIWKNFSDGLDCLNSLPRVEDVVPITRQYDQSHFVTAKRLAKKTQKWLEDFAAAFARAESGESS